MKHYKIRVYGKVQGVWFRKGTQEEAEKIGINGWVKNLPDGSVYIEAEGSEEQLNRLTQWCYRGTPAANPSNVETEEGNVTGFTGFEIRR